MRRITSVAALALLALPLTWAGTAHARVVYTTEEGVTNSNSFTIDVDDSSADDGTDIVLEFGDGGETITYDNTNNLFTISDDLDFGGNQAMNMVLYSGTDTAGVAAPAEGMVFWDTDDDTVFVYDSNTLTWIPIGGIAGGNADTLDTLDSTQFLRSDTSDNYTSGTLTFDSGTSLTGAAGSTVDFDAADVNINGVNNQTFTVNEDDAGAESVTLQFGGTLAETITVDNVTGNFQFSDDIEVAGTVAATGDITSGGNFAQDGNTFNLNDDADVDADVSIVANQNTTAETGILRYNSTTDRWEVSSDNGTTYSAVSYAGARSDVIAAEYPNMTLIEEDGAGVSSGNHSGTLISERDATEDMNYYSWEARKTALNDYTIAVEWYLPETFDTWQGPNSLSLRYLTEDADTTDNSVSVWAVNASGTTVASSLTNASTSWTDINLDLTSGTFNPGENITVFITLRSRRDGGGGGADPRHARVGDLTFNYNSL